MNALFNCDPALYGAVMFHGAGLLPKLRALTATQLNEMLNSAGEHSMENPLFMQPCASSRTYVLAHLDGKFSGAQVISAMVFGLFVSMGESLELCAPLVDKWPIKEALLLAAGKEGVTP